MKLTDAQIRTLKAVEAGKAQCTYTHKGNSLKGAGLSSRVLRELERMKLIEDGKKRTGGHPLEPTYTQILTPAGRAALKE